MPAETFFFSTTSTLKEKVALLFCRWWVYFVAGHSELKTGFLLLLIKPCRFLRQTWCGSGPVQRLSAKGGNLAPKKCKSGQGSVSEHTCQHRCGLTNSCIILDSHYHRLTAILRLINEKSRRRFLFSKLAYRLISWSSQSISVNQKCNYINLKNSPCFKDIHRKIEILYEACRLELIVKQSSIKTPLRRWTSQTWPHSHTLEYPPVSLSLSVCLSAHMHE